MFEFLTLFGILTVGSAVFWCFWAAFILIDCVLVGLTEKNHWGWATTLIIASFIFLGGSHIFNLYQYAITNPWRLILWALAYIGIGLVWGVGIKWWRYVTKAKKRYLEARDTFLAANKATELTDRLRVLWTQQLMYQGVDAKPPKARDNKEIIINWMAFWPWSMLGTILYDFLRNLWDALYDAVSGVCDSIAKSVFSDVSGDVLTQEQYDVNVTDTIRRTVR